jgi:hypothetical protein
MDSLRVSHATRQGVGYVKELNEDITGATVRSLIAIDLI